MRRLLGGFGWTLPTIAHHCGLIGFSSQKLGWLHRPMHGGSKYPFALGLWTGVDGNSIMMAHGYNYGMRWDNEDLSHNQQLLRLAQQGYASQLYHYYGTGDVGGSPSIESVLSVQKGLKGNGPLKIVSAASDQLFKQYLPYSSHPELPRYDGELLMDVHGTGCYTSQAAMKLYNRQNEQLGDAAERASVAAAWLTGEPYPSQQITQGWRRFLWHQFHNDLTSTSIPRAYEFSWNDESLTLKQFADVMAHSVQAVANNMDTRTKGTPVVLYNPLGYDVHNVVEVEVPATTRPANAEVLDQHGRKARAQVTGYADGCAKVPNEFRYYGNFEGGYSYAQELLPHELVVDNIVFKIEKDEPVNGMACDGQSIELPDGCNKLYLLSAACTQGQDAQGTVKAGDREIVLNVPSYTGFIGQWGHSGHTEGYLKEARVAYCGTHLYELLLSAKHNFPP